MTEGAQGWLRRDPECGLRRGTCMAAVTLRSEEVASQRLQDTRTAREACGSSPSSDDSSHTSTQSPLE